MLEPGTLLIEKSAPRPPCFELAPESGPDSWVTFAHHLNQHDLEKELARGGWTFFYRAGAIRATAFGFSPQTRMASLLKKLSAIATAQACNCLEIDTLTDRSVLGLPYLTASAHSRNVIKDGASYQL